MTTGVVYTHRKYSLVICCARRVWSQACDHIRALCQISLVCTRGVGYCNYCKLSIAAIIAIRNALDSIGMDYAIVAPRNRAADVKCEIAKLNELMWIVRCTPDRNTREQ